MASRSPSIDDPLTGQHLTFTHIADDTRGTSLRAVVCLDPAGFVPRHLHLRQDEHLEVLAGSIRLRAGGASRLLSAGDTVTIRRRHLHAMANAGTTEASFVLEVHPARRIERTIRFTFAIGRTLSPLTKRSRSRRGPPGNPTSQDGDVSRARVGEPTKRADGTIARAP